MKKQNRKKLKLRLQSPIEVLFEGADLEKYHKTDKLDKSVVDELAHIKEKFCYLICRALASRRFWTGP